MKRIIPTFVIACGLSFVIGTIATISAIAGKGGISAWEGRYNPVTSALTVTTIETDKKGGSLISGYFDILRPGECSWRGFDWKLGDRFDRNVPIVVITGKPKIRIGGRNLFENWRLVDIEPAQVKNTFADVLHDCGRPWVVRTNFWQ